MKITKLNWDQGKKYVVKFNGPAKVNEREIIVDNNDLKLTNGTGRFLTEEVCLLYVIEYGDFEEVIEPVDFLTAYNDCVNNGTPYYNKEYCTKTFMKRIGDGIHITTELTEHHKQEGYGYVNTNGEWYKQ